MPPATSQPPDKDHAQEPRPGAGLHPRHRLPSQPVRQPIHHATDQLANEPEYHSAYHPASRLRLQEGNQTGRRDAHKQGEQAAHHLEQKPAQDPEEQPGKKLKEYRIGDDPHPSIIDPWVPLKLYILGHFRRRRRADKLPVLFPCSASSRQRPPEHWGSNSPSCCQRNTDRECSSCGGTGDRRRCASCRHRNGIRQSNCSSTSGSTCQGSSKTGRRSRPDYATESSRESRRRCVFKRPANSVRYLHWYTHCPNHSAGWFGSRFGSASTQRRLSSGHGTRTAPGATPGVPVES
jgi:hypothetical protein